MSREICVNGHRTLDNGRTDRRTDGRTTRTHNSISSPIFLQAGASNSKLIEITLTQVKNKNLNSEIILMRWWQNKRQNNVVFERYAAHFCGPKLACVTGGMLSCPKLHLTAALTSFSRDVIQLVEKCPILQC